MSKPNTPNPYLLSPEKASDLKTPEDWTFYILNEQSGISEKNFYKLFMYAEYLPKIYGVPEQMRSQVTESILETLKQLT